MRRAALPVLLILALLFIASGCREKQELTFISLNAGPEAEIEDTKDKEPEVLLMAIACFASAPETIHYYENMLDYLQTHLGMPVELILRKTYAEVNDLLRAGTVHFAYISTYSYLLLEQEVGLELLVAPAVAEGASFNSYIIVHKNSGIVTFEGLRGKSFAFTDPASTMGFLYPLYLLKATGESADSFFSNHIFAFSSDHSIRSVADKLVDGAAVNNLVYNYLYQRMPDLFKDIVIIHKSPGFSPNPIVVSPALEPALRERLQTAFLTMHENEAGRNILAELKFRRFIPQLQTSYEEIRAMAESLDG